MFDTVPDRSAASGSNGVATPRPQRVLGVEPGGELELGDPARADHLLAPGSAAHDEVRLGDGQTQEVAEPVAPVREEDEHGEEGRPRVELAVAAHHLVEALEDLELEAEAVEAGGVLHSRIGEERHPHGRAVETVEFAAEGVRGVEPPCPRRLEVHGVGEDDLGVASKRAG
jgi:hypothetical protein